SRHEPECCRPSFRTCWIGSVARRWETRVWTFWARREGEATTPNPRGAEHQTCPRSAVHAPHERSLAVSAAEIGHAIRCSRPEPYSPQSGFSRSGLAHVGFRPRSIRLSPSTRERVPPELLTDQGELPLHPLAAPPEPAGNLVIGQAIQLREG